MVFFMHGILDTSLGWVSNGVLGSQAFAAWDSGHDVWLGNSRSNPPRAHVSPHKQGAYYWRYTMNELGAEDIAAQVGWQGCTLFSPWFRLPLAMGSLLQRCFC